MKDEFLEIFDETMVSKGLKKRSEIHKDGDLHQVVHCWGYEKVNDEIWIYFQQRSFNKKDYAGLYDLLATGHINDYENITNAVIRETFEETGIKINKDRLIYMGRVRQNTFNEKIKDNEMTNVFIYELENHKFNPNNEVERMIKIKLYDYKKFMSNNEEFVIGYTLDDELIRIGKNEWCDKSNEYRAFIEKNGFFF